MSAVAAQIISFLAAELDRAGQPATLTAETPLLDSGLIDSVTLMQLVAFLEETFGIALEADQIVPEHFATVDRIAALVSAAGADTTEVDTAGVDA
jgi:acyl carrier protein